MLTISTMLHSGALELTCLVSVKLDVNLLLTPPRKCVESRDITLPTKVFLVVVYGCESWAIKKAKRLRIYAFNCGAERKLF